jgi:hypothetical protein
MTKFTSTLFTLPARFLKPTFSFEIFIKNLNEKARLLDLQLSYFHLTATCINRRANGPLESIELGLEDQEELYERVKRLGPFSKETVFLMFCVFEGEDLSLKQFFNWWVFDVIDFDVQEILFYVNNKKYNRFWMDRELGRFAKTKPNGNERTVLEQQRGLLLSAALLGDNWGDPLIGTRLNFIWQYDTSLEKTEFDRNNRFVKKFLIQNSCGWQLIFPVGLNYITLTNQAQDGEKFQLRLVLSDYLINGGRFTNCYHNQRCMRCNCSAIEFAIESLRELFPRVGFSEIEKLCIICDKDRKPVPNSLFSTRWPRI